MKFCGAMELCAIGYPRAEPIDYDWGAVVKQMEAQNAGVLIAITRGHKPEEAEFMRTKAFIPLYEFTNPRTGTRATVWLCDMTTSGTLKVTAHEPAHELSESAGAGGGLSNTILYDPELLRLRGLALTHSARTCRDSESPRDWTQTPRDWVLDLPANFTYNGPVASTPPSTPSDPTT